MAGSWQEEKMKKVALYDYLAFLEGTFYIKMIRPFSRQRNSEIRKMPMAYLCDSGLAGHFARRYPFLTLRKRSGLFRDCKDPHEPFPERDEMDDEDFSFN